MNIDSDSEYITEKGMCTCDDEAHGAGNAASEEAYRTASGAYFPEETTQQGRSIPSWVLEADAVANTDIRDTHEIAIDVPPSRQKKP